ncbi:MAG: LysE family transporter [Aureispira sp.]|nr:LysE family transporter [Aureispira sp.]
MIWSALIEGMSYGLVLSVLVGPMFFTIVQVGIERGFKAGTALVAGQWISDFVYMGLVFWGASYIQVLVDDEAARNSFIFYMGIIGSVILVGFGVAMILKESVVRNQLKVKKSTLLGYGVQGFLLNTFNPTPLFFWMALMSSALTKGYSSNVSYVLFGSVMFVVIVTDILKVYLAKRIRTVLKDQYILYVRRLAGAVLIGFGLWLIIKVLTL